MHFPPLVRGRLIQRYKRFFADFLLDDGRTVTAHCANPGSMKSIVEHRPEGLLSVARPGRKLGYTWEIALLNAEGDSPTWVHVNPARANQLVAEAISQRVIPELIHYDLILPEVRYGKNSRIDFVLHGSSGRAYVEVKNVTLSLGKGRGAFPDSVTERGVKHLRELVQIRKEGHRAVLVFCVSRSDVTRVEAARAIDPLYAQTLDWAAAQGVEIYAYGGDLGERAFSLSRPIPVVLGSEDTSV